MCRKGETMQDPRGYDVKKSGIVRIARLLRLQRWPLFLLSKQRAVLPMVLGAEVVEVSSVCGLHASEPRTVLPGCQSLSGSECKGGALMLAVVVVLPLWRRGWTSPQK